MLTSFLLPVIYLFPLVVDDVALIATPSIPRTTSVSGCLCECPVDPSTTDPQSREPKPCEPQSRLTKVYRLEYVDVNTVARKVNDAVEKLLKAKPRHDGVITDSPVVVIPEPASNSLIVSAERPYASMIELLLKELDDPGERILVQAKITLMSASGKETVISRPQIMTIDGCKAVVSIATADGEELKLELTPYIVKPDAAYGH